MLCDTFWFVLSPNRYPLVPAMRVVITIVIAVRRQLDEFTAVTRFVVCSGIDSLS